MYEAIKESQSLRKSGLCRPDVYLTKLLQAFIRRNPFVNQVFVVTQRTRQKRMSAHRSQSLRKSGLCRLHFFGDYNPIDIEELSQSLRKSGLCRLVHGQDCD